MNPSSKKTTARHESGHLAILFHVFEGLQNTDRTIEFATILEWKDSKGCVSWNPGLVDPEKMCMVHLAGYLANCFFSPEEKMEHARGAENDFSLIDALHLPEKTLSRIVETTSLLVIQLSEAIEAIANELLEWDTFYGIEALGVAFIHLSQDNQVPQVRERIDTYRRERRSCEAPKGWDSRGPWLEPFETWCLRSFGHQLR